MKTPLTRHLTPGNAVAMIALVIALGGTAVAASNLPNGSVTTAKLASSSVTSDKLANSAVKSAKLANASVTSAKIAPGTLDASRFKPDVLGGLSTSKITIVAGTPVNVPASSTGTTATAGCPAGQRAVSGGFNVGSFAVVDATGPTGDGLGWSVTAETGATPASISATAVCVAP
jgi:hypothetical protein